MASRVRLIEPMLLAAPLPRMHVARETRRWRVARATPHAGAVAAAEDRSDEALMMAFRNGEAEAFGHIVKRNQRALYNFLLRSVNRPARAEELLQEVFVRAIRAKDRYEQTAKVTTWLFTIARNLCIDEGRRQKFRRHASLDSAGKDASRDPMIARVSDGNANVERAVDGSTIRTRVRAAVAELPPEQREVFVMRQASGLAFREIAEALGVPENTVKSRMRYALSKLREELGDLRGLMSPEAAGRRGGTIHA